MQPVPLHRVLAGEDESTRSEPKISEQRQERRHIKDEEIDATVRWAENARDEDADR